MSRGGERVGMAWLGIAATILVMCGTGRSRPDSPEEPTSDLRMRRLREVREGGDPGAIHRAASEALLDEPASVPLLTILGDAALELGRAEEAEVIYRRLVDERPEDGALSVRLGRALALSGSTKEALVHLEAGLLLGDASPGLARTIAELWVAEGDLERAIRFYDLALEGEDIAGREGLSLRRAQLLVLVGDGPAARGELEALALSERAEIRGEACLLLGRLEAGEGRIAEAEERLSAAAELGVTDGELDVYLGVALFRTGDWKGAGEALGRGLLTRPDDGPARRALVLCHLEADEPERALDELLRYVEIHGLDATARELVTEVVRREVAGPMHPGGSAEEE